MMQRQQFRHDMQGAAKALHEQSLKLIPVETRLNMVEKQLQEQIVIDVFRGNKAHANMLANELVIIRKVSKLVLDLKMIFETLIVRIGTVSDYDDFSSSINAAATSLKEVKHDLAQVTPAAKAVFSDVSDTIQTLSTLDIKHHGKIENVTDDALEILEEANSIVEERLKRKFHTLPEIEPERRVAVNA